MGVFTMTIDWYYNNSDKRKINKDVTFVKTTDCNIYGVCDFDSPRFLVNSVLGNYVKYGSDYFFITSKTYTNGKWIINCQRDDLYSDRVDILNLTALVARNEFGKLSDIPDTSVCFKANKDVHYVQLSGGTKLGINDAPTKSVCITVNN